MSSICTFRKRNRRSGRAQWRHGDEIGLAFGQAAQSNQSAEHAAIGELLARIEKLEQEIGSLKRMYKRLRADVPGDPEAA
jgi:hypothetical protein